MPNVRRDVQADQAAGLRSKGARQGPKVISLLSLPPDWAARLAQALQALNHKILLVDSAGRHTLASKTQFIFGWEQQVARQRLQTITMNGIDVLHAPGAYAGDAAIVQTGVGYDYVLFDGQTLQPETLNLDPSTPQTLVVALNAHPDALCNTYALIKTLHQNKLAWRVMLLGESSLGERLVSATDYFMQGASPCLERVNIEADAHLAALAARISAAGIGTSPFYTNTGGECAQHG